MTALTFGCRLNTAESEAMAALAPGTSIVNTCAVTLEAERQARQAIRRHVREHPGATVVVTGCAATIDPAPWAALPGVTRVVANDDKLRPETWGAAAPAAPASRRTRLFLDVQGGCDHRCTFCIIPRGRGPSRSLPIPDALAASRRAADAGTAEIVLTGVDLASYAPGLGRLVRTILRDVPSLPRLRLSSLDPAALDDDLWDAFATEPRLLPHLHLSVQSGHDLILKRMKRRHTRAGALAVVRRARALRPDVAVGADLIAGFPTETDAMAADTIAFVQEAGLTYLHVFPFSERPGTPAARMPPVPLEIRRVRAAALRAEGGRQAARFHAALVGRTAAVLAERGNTGHTEHFAPVRIDAPPGALVTARLLRVEHGRLVAEAA